MIENNELVVISPGPLYDEDYIFAYFAFYCKDGKHCAVYAKGTDGYTVRRHFGTSNMYEFYRIEDIKQANHGVKKYVNTTRY